jgi:hypothetical protein
MQSYIQCYDVTQSDMPDMGLFVNENAKVQLSSNLESNGDFKCSIR